MFLFGGQDPLIPPADVEAVRGALRAADADAEVVVYDTATHGFFCELRSSYEPAAAADAMTRVTSLFAEALHVP